MTYENSAHFQIDTNEAENEENVDKKTESLIPVQYHCNNMPILNEHDTELLQKLLGRALTFIRDNMFPIMVSCVLDSVQDCGSQEEFYRRYQTSPHFVKDLQYIPFPVNVVRRAHVELEKAGYVITYLDNNAQMKLKFFRNTATMMIYKPMVPNDDFKNRIRAEQTDFFYQWQ